MSITVDSKLAHLCHIVKRDDFDGYGFNLHAEKGKPGQYIGKVDDNSPAEMAGLHQGDRIIEVNGVNIGNETHKQVVQRIKAIANEVRLLVIDPMHCGVTSPNDTINLTTKTNDITDGNGNLSTSDQCLQNVNGNGNGNSNGTTASVQNSMTNSEKSSNDDNSTTTTTVVSSLAPSSPANKSTNNSSHASPEKNNHLQKTGGLNLNMSAAELRAKLAAKKKYDPKNDTVDLRKKYEIVQKL